ncbi:MAG: [LysW]-lysine hydrolase [Anaerolineae bacterium]|nr:[LysW]-lysine hydrolase [Anaerolineae bacterium]
MEAVPFLKDLLAIPSPSGEESEVAAFLVNEMANLGFQSRIDGAGNAIGTAGDPSAPRTIVLLGHMDTVPGHIPVRWEGDLLYGRGAVDAKGPLAAFLAAAARVAPQLHHSKLVVIGAVEEESHGRGARHLAERMPAPDYAIIGEPSDWQGVTLGYKGMMSFRYQLQQPGGHSAGEFPGPAEKAIDLWNRLVAHAAAQNDGQSGRFQTLDPALREFRTFGDGLYDGVEMHVGLRLPQGVDTGELEHEIRSWCNGARLTFYPSDPPFLAEKNTPLVRAMLRAIRAQGGRPRFKVKTGTADMNIVGPAWGCPIVAYGPGDSAFDHTPDERIDVNDYLRAIDVLATALPNL